jgi:hypothetical protein
MPAPTAGLRTLLGSLCFDCKVRADAKVVAERERAHVAALVAAGYSPEDAAHHRPGDPRATGTIWAAGKTPIPSYYRPGRRR